MRWKLATALAAAVFASGAQAAEPKVPFSWSGFYIGAHGGYGWGENKWSDFVDPVNPLNTVPGPDASYDVNGALVGGQIGYNWQVQGGVLGIEADASWANMRGSGSDSPTFFGGCLQHIKCNSQIQALGTITGRMGVVVDRALVYAKAGVAWAQDKHAIGYKDDPDPAFRWWADPSQTRWGWTLGAGVEYAFAPGWSGRIEYNYIDLGDDRVNFNFSPPQTFAASANSQEVLHTVKIGINYRFGN